MKYIGPLPDSNYMAGRNGNRVELIVDHWMAGSFAGADARFRNPSAQVSAHYAVNKGGSVYQWVADTDTAYHCGNWDTNLRSIGIEHECGPDDPPTEALYLASRALHAELARAHGLVLAVGSTVLPHRDIVATQCPGTLDLTRLVNALDHTVLGPTTKRLPDEPQFPRDLVSLYETLAPRAGIRAEIAFAQMLHETDRWRFTGTAKPEWNNPAGLGVTGAPDTGNRFPTVEDGVRAQLGHLLWYFGPHIPEFCDQDQRHFGDHKNLPNDIRQLNGRWAVPGDSYGERIAAIAAAFEEEDMDTAELERRIDAKIAEYGSRLQPELEVDRKRIDVLEQRVNSINVAGEHDHEIPVMRTGGPVKR